MEFDLSPEEQEFEEKVRDFFVSEDKIVKEARREWDGGLGFGPYCWKILGKIGERGWLCPTWPCEYGGLNLSYMYRYIVMEQMHYFVNIYATVGAGMAGPVILRHGSEAQKGEYLLPIAKGEIEFALGYTEPQAGSDLASLSIKAEDKGDFFLINGTKLFNTRCHYAQYHWLGARTRQSDPQYKGISLFIVDLKTPGISINPIMTIGGVRTNEVSYDNVHVPKECLVGEENRGFYYILEALGYERICTVSGLVKDLEDIIAYVRENGLGKDRLTRQKLAGLATEVEGARLLALKVAWMLNKKQIPTYEAAMLKVVVSETEQRVLNTALQILGRYGQIREGSEWAAFEGRYERKYRDSLENLITRGTSEIMRSVIADRGLGLPRG